jgi:hypothetical protein
MNSRSKCHRSVSSGAGLPLVIVLVVLAVGAHAQGQRDPTIPRAAFGLSGASGDALAPTLDAGPMTVIVRNGQPSQGQTLGNTRVERITETEIWLREEGQLRKVPRFAGIQRRSSQP